VLGERMQEPQRAQEVYRYIVERYPDTEASRFARVRLPPTS
jgi:TolA-binding protein